MTLVAKMTRADGRDVLDCKFVERVDMVDGVRSSEFEVRSSGVRWVMRIIGGGQKAVGKAKWERVSG